VERRLNFNADVLENYQITDVGCDKCDDRSNRERDGMAEHGAAYYMHRAPDFDTKPSVVSARVDSLY
jgi:hypothetical protein